MIHAFGWFLLSLPFLVIIGSVVYTDIERHGWKNVLIPMAAFFGAVGSIVLGAYFIVHG